MTAAEHNNFLINPGRKASDVIASYPEIVSLVKTFGIPLGFGDITLGQLCERNSVPENLFIALCNMLLYSDYEPDTDRLGTEDLMPIVSFLESSHSYYRQVLFPQLHSDVHKIAELCPHETKALVNRFFDEYDEEMSRHIDSEEQNEFRYIRDLVEGRISNGSTISGLGGQHDDAEVKLEDFKNIITKYVPEECNIPERYTAVIKMIHIEKQLRFHTRVEDCILQPLVRRIEKEEGR